jgi:hypothetical protein
MKLTYADKVQITKDYKKLGTNLTSKKWQIPRRYVVTLANNYKNNSLNKHTKNKSLHGFVGFPRDDWYLIIVKK